MFIPFTPYESAAKLRHNTSPTSHPLLKGFPIKIVGGVGLDMDTLSTMPPNLLKKSVSEFACGFPEIQLKIFVRPPGSRHNVYVARRNSLNAVPF